MVSSLSPGKEKEITATIIVSDSLFYLLINQGNANNADVNYFVDERKYFSPIDKTRFVSFNNQYLSFEIDDERNYYIIATSALGLLEFDELFDIAKDISNYSPENFNKRILDWLI